MVDFFRVLLIIISGLVALIFLLLPFGAIFNKEKTLFMSKDQFITTRIYLVLALIFGSFTLYLLAPELAIAIVGLFLFLLSALLLNFFSYFLVHKHFNKTYQSIESRNSFSQITKNILRGNFDDAIEKIKTALYDRLEKEDADMHVTEKQEE